MKSYFSCLSNTLLVAVILALAQSATGRTLAVLDLSDRPDVLSHFKDCSTYFWFDQQQNLLLGRNLALQVPKGAAVVVKHRYVKIRIHAGLQSLPVASLFLPGFAIGTTGGQQNSVMVAQKVGHVRQALSRLWGIEFAEGQPEGPDIDADQVQYFSAPASSGPSLRASSQSALQTEIKCSVPPG